jgi:hypothetical protein
VWRPRGELAASRPEADLCRELHEVTDVMVFRAEERHVDAEVRVFIHGRYSAVRRRAGLDK